MDSADRHHCRNCGADNPPGADFCEKCNAMLLPSTQSRQNERGSLDGLGTVPDDEGGEPQNQPAGGLDPFASRGPSNKPRASLDGLQTEADETCSRDPGQPYPGARRAGGPARPPALAYIDLIPSEEGDDSPGPPTGEQIRKHLRLMPVASIERDFAGHLYLLKAGTKEGVPLDRPVVRIGRGDSNDLVLTSERISRRHLVVAAIGRHLVAINCQEPGRTHLNGNELTQARLRSGDKIELPGLSLILTQAPGKPVHFGYRLSGMAARRDARLSGVVMGEVLATVADEAPREHRQDSRWSITCYRRKARGATYVFTDSTGKTMGTGSDCDLQVRETDVKPRHIRFVAGPDGLQVDVLPGNPAIRVNGVTTEKATLQRGDTFAVGKTRFVVHLPLS